MVTCTKRTNGWSCQFSLGISSILARLLPFAWNTWLSPWNLLKLEVQQLMRSLGNVSDLRSEELKKSWRL